MEGIDRPRNFFKSIPKRRHSREIYAANVAFPHDFHDSFVSSEATCHGLGRSHYEISTRSKRYLIAAIVVAFQVLFTVTLQFMGQFDACIKSLINDPFGKVGQSIAAFYLAIGVLYLVAIGLLKLKDRMIKRHTEVYLKDSDT